MQLLFGAALYLAVAAGVPLLWVIAFGSALGIVLGKVFCRWLCPMGFVMETMLGATGERSKAGSMYQYFKIGCPIAWISGLLNRLSLFKVKLDARSCASCGKCDSACYVAQHNEEYSLYERDKLNPSTHYACSRCLACVEACPTTALGVGVESER